MFTLILKWYRFKYKSSYKHGQDDIKTMDIQASNELHANEELYDKTKAVWWEAIPYTLDTIILFVSLYNYM